MDRRKILIVALGVILLVVIFFGGLFVGKKIVEDDVNNKISNRELIVAALNKNEILSAGELIQQNKKEFEQEMSKIVDENRNEINGFSQAANEITGTQLKEKISNLALYGELKNKSGDEFFGTNVFVEQSGAYSKNSELGKFSEKINSGTIKFLDLYGKKVFSAPNYMHWSFDDFSKQLGAVADMGSPTALIVTPDNVVWYNVMPCVGGARSTDVILQQEFYEQHKCSIVSDVLLNFRK